MKKPKINQNLLNEELKKFKLLSEYTFYTEVNSDKLEDDLLLGNLDEADETPDAANDIAKELDIDPPSGDNDTSMDEPVDDETNPAAIEDPTETPEQPTETPPSDEVDIDVTELVNNTDEAKQAAQQAQQAADSNTQMLLQKLTDLENRLNNMDNVAAKIDGLEKEIIKRNPTDEEKLSLRSLSSYPYSQKLTDYWSDKTGKYDVLDNDNNPKEYILTQDDINSEYNDLDIKKSFSVNSSDYEEEEI